MTSAHDGCSSPCNVCSPGPVSEVRAVESAGFSPAPSLPGERTQRGAGSSLPSSRGWGTGRDSRAGSNFRCWAEPRGKRRAAGTSRDAMPASNLGGERAPGGPRVAPCCQPGFAPWARAAGEAGGPGAVLLLIQDPPSPGSSVPQFPCGEAGGGRRAGQARGSSPGSAKPYYFPTTVSSSLLIKLDPAVHNSH